MQSENEPKFQAEAYPLVVFNPDKNCFEINEETRDFLKQLEGPIGVISVAGMYRTGKSYLLNRMLLNQSKGFDVGPTINACTKGVWIWGQPIEGRTPDDEPIKVLVLDTEGLGALDEDSNHDVRIFSLAILLASFFIYNSVGSIDENALNQLSLVINLTKHIQIKAGGAKEETDPDEYAQYFPSFMWVVRDFTLQLQDADGEQITPKEYLEKALAQQKGFSESVESKNRIRRLLKSFFKERDCQTMIRPLTKEDQLQNLAELPMEQLRPEFVDQVESLRKRVIKRIKPKQMYGRKLNGDMLFNLAQSYVEAINNGAVPSIENSWSYICKDECLKAMQTALQQFESQFYEDYQNNVPMFEYELLEWYKLAKKQALEVFNKKAVGDVKEQFLKDLKTKMREKLDFFKHENKETSKNECLNFMQHEYQQISQQLRNNQYPDIESYASDVKIFETYCFEQAPKGPSRAEEIFEFCYANLAEGAVFINKGILNEVTYIQQVGEQTQNKLKSEIQDLKQRYQQDCQTLQDKLRAQEIALTESTAKEAATQEHLTQIQQEKQRQEVDFETRTAQLKREHQDKEEQLLQKISILEKEQKEFSRRQVQQDLEFQTSRELMEQKLEFNKTHIQSLEEQEKKLNFELKQQKQDSNQQLVDQKNKFEAKIQELQQALNEAQDLNFELEDKLQQNDHSVKERIKKFDEKELQLQKELTKLKETLVQTQKDNQEGKSNSQLQMQEVQQRKDAEIENLKQENLELQADLKDAEEEISTMKRQGDINQAKFEQSTEFLKLKFEQEREAREKEKRDHEKMLKTIQNSQRESVIGKEEANKQIEEMRAQFTEEYSQQQALFDADLAKKEKENQVLMENCQKLEFRVSQLMSEFKKDTDSLKDNLGQAEQDRDRLQKINKQLEQNLIQMRDQAHQSQQSAVQDLEKELEDTKESHEAALQEIAQQSEQQIQLLKQMFESDKQKLQQRLVDEKDRAKKQMADIVKDQEQQRQDDKLQFDDELEYVTSQLQQTEEAYNKDMSYMNQELGLHKQEISQLQQQIKEAKESLEKQQNGYSLQLEQIQQKSQSDRRELTEKVDQLTSEITKRERACTNMENQKEALLTQLNQKEKQLQSLKEGSQKQLSDIQEKLQETKLRLEEKEDELTKKVIEFDRSTALNQQTIKFTEQKAADLQAQIDRNQQRFDERCRLDKEEMQRELREKTQRLQAEKENSDAKFEAKRKQLKELEQRRQQEASKFDQERLELSLKQQNLQEQLELRERNLESQNQQLREAYNNLCEQSRLDNETFDQKCQLQEQKINELESKLQDEQNKYDKDAALWEGKMNFLEQQKDQYKKDLDEASQKFQQTVDQITKQQNDNKNKQDNTHNIVVTDLQKQFQQRLKEQNEQHSQQILELNQKLKQAEREKGHLTDRLELVSRDQIKDINIQQKKSEKLQDQLQRLMEELESVKKDRDVKLEEYKQKIEKEKEAWQQKKRDLESRGANRDAKQTELLLNHEKDRAKWDQQIQDLIHQKDDFKSENERLKSKVEQQFKEIEKYKLEARQSRRAPAIGGNPLTQTIGAGLASKLNFNRQSGTGYTPGANSMFQTNRSNQQPNAQTEDSKEASEGQQQRYSSGRFNLGGLEKSTEFKLAGQGGFQPSAISAQKSQPMMSPNMNQKVKLQQSADQDEQKNQVSTPQSSKDDQLE